jgi:putative endonuclease
MLQRKASENQRLFAFMTFTVYLLYSPSFDKTYVGFTSNLEARLLSHNELGTKDWATKYKPWTLVHTEIFESKSEAMAREKFYKSGIGRNLFLQILQSKGYRK